jgi:hypothetical protein
MENKSEIVIYQAPGGNTKVDVRLENETVWLTQKFMAELFQTTPQNITIHLKNIYEEGELNENSTCKDFLQVQIEGKRTVERNQKHYNLDAILSIGYRIKSHVATRFRQWATERLRDHLVNGYTLNEGRLRQVMQNMHELENTIKFIQQSGKSDNLQLSEAKGLLDIIAGYTQSFILLNQFDNHNLTVDTLNENITYEINYKEAVSAISELKKQLIKKKESGDLFGKQKDEGFKGILGNIVQTFNGEYLYKSIERK